MHSFISTIAIISIIFCSCSHAANYYVCGNGSACGAGWSTGSDGNAGISRSAPCQTITAGLGRMSSGDTLIVGNGTYTQSIVDMPGGTAFSASAPPIPRQRAA